MTTTHQTETMRAVRLVRVGEPAEALEVVEVARPSPGPGQVRIRVDATPVHASDLHVMRGRYGYAPALPAVLGLECVGTVEALGEGTVGLAVGQRVVGLGVLGTWQQYVVADVDRLLPVPASLDDSSAAQLVVNPLAAWLLVEQLTGVEEGDWVLVTAAGSTVARLVLQLAARRGLRTIGVVRRDAAVEGVRALGADEVVSAEDADLERDLVGRVRELTGGRGVPWALDCVTGPVGAAAARALAPGGTMIVYGALAGHRQAAPEALALPLAASSLIYGTATVRGWWLVSWFFTTPPAEARAQVETILDLVASNRLRIPEGEPFALDDVLAATRVAETPGRSRKPLLLPNGSDRFRA